MTLTFTNIRRETNAIVESESLTTFCDVELTVFYSEKNTIQYKPVYKGHWWESEKGPVMRSCPLYTGSNYIHYSLKGDNETCHYRQWYVICKCPLRKVWLYLRMLKVIHQS